MRQPRFSVVRGGWRGGQRSTVPSIVTTRWHGRRVVAAAAAVAVRSASRTTDGGPGGMWAAMAGAREGHRLHPTASTSHAGNRVDVN